PHPASALPALLGRADETAALPQGALLAAEAVAFPSFPSLLRDRGHPEARPALRTLLRAARGCREGIVDPAAMVRAGLADQLAALSDTPVTAADPWHAAAVVESERVFRRLDHWARWVPPQLRPPAEQPAPPP